MRHLRKVKYISCKRGDVLGPLTCHSSTSEGHSTILPFIKYGSFVSWLAYYLTDHCLSQKQGSCYYLLLLSKVLKASGRARTAGTRWPWSDGGRGTAGRGGLRQGAGARSGRRQPVFAVDVVAHGDQPERLEAARVGSRFGSTIFYFNGWKRIEQVKIVPCFFSRLIATDSHGNAYLICSCC